jgi:hypothetical protein
VCYHEVVNLLALVGIFVPDVFDAFLKLLGCFQPRPVPIIARPGARADTYFTR